MSQNRTNNDGVYLRFPDGLRDRIKSHAKANGQSMNAAIIVALEVAYPAPAEPEHVNQRLLRSALVLAGQWSACLTEMGVDTKEHPALQRFFKEAQEAMEVDNGDA